VFGVGRQRNSYVAISDVDIRVVVGGICEHADTRHKAHGRSKRVTAPCLEYRLVLTNPVGMVSHPGEERGIGNAVHGTPLETSVNRVRS